MKKVLVKKSFNPDHQAKILNLNNVSASCPVLNLKKNVYNEIYLKANQVSHYH